MTDGKEKRPSSSVSVALTNPTPTGCNMRLVFFSGALFTTLTTFPDTEPVDGFGGFSEDVAFCAQVVIETALNRQATRRTRRWDGMSIGLA